MTETERLAVALGDRSYDIHIGPGLIAGAASAAIEALPRGTLIVVTDETVAALHLDALVADLRAAGRDVLPLVVPAGESSKRFAVLQDLCERALAAGIDRDAGVVALGGGVVGDLAGFLAAVLLRGLDFVQVPTTLLAQVDSSVGGKTGINSDSAGKNLIGAFHQPRLVLADTACLDTLPRRELLAGYAELAKYGLIDDPDFFAWLEANGADVTAGDGAARRNAVRTGCAAKARIVAADEHERSGARALLNLGHTFGHALEAEFGYDGRLLHGEAVAIGMAMAFDFSVRRGLCPQDDARRVRAHLTAVGLPVDVRAVPNGPPLDPERLLDHMRRDKKARGGSLTFVLVRGIGRAFVARDVADADARDFLETAIA